MGSSSDSSPQPMQPQPVFGAPTPMPTQMVGGLAVSPTGQLMAPGMAGLMQGPVPSGPPQFGSQQFGQSNGLTPIFPQPLPGQQNFGGGGFAPGGGGSVGSVIGGMMLMPDGSLVPAAQGQAMLAQMSAQNPQHGSPVTPVQQFVNSGVNPTWTGQHWVMPNGTIVDPGSTNGPQFVGGNWVWSDGTPAVFGPGTANPGIGGSGAFGSAEGSGDSGNGEGGMGESGGSGASGGGGPGEGGGANGAEADNV